MCHDKKSDRDQGDTQDGPLIARPPLQPQHRSARAGQGREGRHAQDRPDGEDDRQQRQRHRALLGRGHVDRQQDLPRRQGHDRHQSPEGGRMRNRRLGQIQRRPARRRRSADHRLDQIEAAEAEQQHRRQMRQQTGDHLVQRHAGRDDQTAHHDCRGDMGQPRRRDRQKAPRQAPALGPADQHERQPVRRQGRMQEGGREPAAEKRPQDRLFKGGRRH